MQLFSLLPAKLGWFKTFHYTPIIYYRVWRINYAENVLYVSGPSVQGVTGSVLHVCDTKLYVSQIIIICISNYIYRFSVEKCSYFGKQSFMAENIRIFFYWNYNTWNLIVILRDRKSFTTVFWYKLILPDQIKNIHCLGKTIWE